MKRINLVRNRDYYDLKINKISKNYSRAAIYAAYYLREYSNVYTKVVSSKYNFI